MDWADELSVETLGRILECDSSTGVLSWKPRGEEYFKDGRWSSLEQSKRWNTRYAGKTISCKASGGYVIFGIANKLFKAHRVVWAMHHGKWPEGHIDHINRNTSDNRISNLREVSHGENMQNRKKQSNNTSGVTGVTWIKARNVWTAKIGIGGKTIHLGEFIALDDAIAKRLSAEKAYNFMPFHGRLTQMEGGM